MIDLLTQFWSSILLPLSWMPSFCQEVCAIVLTLMAILTLIAVVVKLVPNALSLFFGG